MKTIESLCFSSGASDELGKLKVKAVSVGAPTPSSALGRQYLGA